MGHDIDSLYIGPVVRLKPLRLEFETEYDSTVCKNAVCKQFMMVLTTNFCPDCGLAVVANTTFLKTSKMADFESFLDDEEMDNSKYNEVFHSPFENSLILMPNSYTKSSLFHDYTGNGEFIPMFAGLDIETRIESFTEEFKNILAALTEYGFDYTIEFGVQPY